MDGYPKHILVVEDDQDIRCLLGDVLRQEGYRVTEACDGRQALAEMKRNRPDLVLCDYHMPYMNGLAFLDISRLVWPKIPVIMTSCDPELLEHRAQQPLLSAFAVLSKPFDLYRLLSLIEEGANSRRPVGLSRSASR